MKKILFLLSRFLDGGIDTVLIDYLRNLSQNPDYHITLAISISMEEMEVFADMVPSNVEVVHLVNSHSLIKWRKRKINHPIPFYAKLYDDILLTPVRRYIIGNKLRAMAKDYDAIIDFDCCHYSYLKHVTTWKVAWFHFSFKHLMEQNPRRMHRIGSRLDYYDRIVTISKAMYEEGVQLFPWLQEKLCIIYNAKNEEGLRQRAAVKVDDKRIQQPYILAVERLEESQKDLSTLIRAYQLLRDQYGHTEKLYLLGKGRDEERLRQLAASLHLSDDVVFLGFHANPYPWIWHASAIAHSAKMEGLPTALIESLLLDKLIVATDCPTGPREILDGGKAGLLVPVGNEKAMAEAMHQLLTDKTLQQSIHQHIFQHKAHFLFTSTGKQFDEVITPRP